MTRRPPPKPPPSFDAATPCNRKFNFQFMFLLKSDLA